MLTALTQRGPTDGHWVQLALPHPSARGGVARAVARRLAKIANERD